MRICLMMMFVCGFVTAKSQTDSLAKKRIAGVSFNMAPSIRILSDAGAFNDALKNSGHPSIQGALRGFDFGFGFLYGKLYAQIIANSYYSSHNDQFNTMQGFGGQARLQYNLSRSEKLFLGPYLGIGGETFQFNFDNSNQRTFQAAMQSVVLGNSTKVNVNSVAGSAGFGIYSMRTRRRGFTSSAGLEVGYVLGSRGRYRVNEELVQAPSSTFSGLEIKVTLRFFVFATPRKTA
jgi:hypothetical protein